MGLAVYGPGGRAAFSLVLDPFHRSRKNPKEEPKFLILKKDFESDYNIRISLHVIVQVVGFESHSVLHRFNIMCFGVFRAYRV